MLVNGKPFRTIWPDPEDNRVIRIIDQRHLPHRFEIEALKNINDFICAIADMHVRGAGLIGATAGFAIYSSLVNAGKDWRSTLEADAKKLVAARPTATNLAWAVKRQLEALKDTEDLEQARETAFTTACAIADEDAECCRRIGEHGAALIEEISRKKAGETVNILTHCNAGWLAFVDYGSATAPIYTAAEKGIKVKVWVDETRPWLQGSRLTAWELGQQGIEHSIIADNTGGHLMQHGLVDMVIVGTDRTTRSGDVANKIGTYLKALAARDNNVPFYVTLPSSTFDWDLTDGVRDIPIEERSGDEILYLQVTDGDGTVKRERIAPQGSGAVNYGFDVTPARLVSGLICERGICPATEEGILKLFPEKKSP